MTQRYDKMSEEDFNNSAMDRDVWANFISNTFLFEESAHAANKFHIVLSVVASTLHFWVSAVPFARLNTANDEWNE